MAAHRAPWLLAGAAAVLLSAACDKPAAPPVSAEPSLSDSADQVMFGVRTNLIGGGLRRGELRSDTAFALEQGRRYELRGVNATFFDATTGAQTGTLVGREGTYNAGTGIMEARGNVVVTSSDGRVLTTPQLRYNSAVNEISSDSAFTFKDPQRGDVEGIGFVSDPSFRTIRVLRTLRAAGRQPVTLPE